ncbi:Type I restriction modification DNA specificity domain-containing protein [Fructobacillus pseudoficulneus]|nr:Type I restriction modification DNA specificity domain-containing protein [Fructobacillus pseudoficulneus]
MTNTWEQRKLEKLAVFSKGQGYSKGDLTEIGDEIILYGRLYTKYETVINTVDTFTNKKSKSILSKGMEVIVPASGETPNEISRASVVDRPGIILGGDLNIIHPNENINSEFLALTLSNGQQQRELARRAQGKSVVHLRTSDLKKVNFLYPSIWEQQKISKLIVKFENLITLHQRIAKMLVNLTQSGQRSHDNINIFIFQFLNNMKIGFLSGRHAGMSQSSSHTSNRNTSKK